MRLNLGVFSRLVVASDEGWVRGILKPASAGEGSAVVPPPLRRQERKYRVFIFLLLLL